MSVLDETGNAWKETEKRIHLESGLQPAQLPVDHRVLGDADQAGQFLDLEAGVHPGLAEGFAEVAGVFRIVRPEEGF